MQEEVACGTYKCNQAYCGKVWAKFRNKPPYNKAPDGWAMKIADSWAMKKNERGSIKLFFIAGLSSCKETYRDGAGSVCVRSPATKKRESIFHMRERICKSCRCKQNRG